MTLWLTDSIMGDLSDTLWRCGWQILLWEICQIRYDVVVDRSYYGRFVRYIMTLWLTDSIIGDLSDTLWRCGWQIPLWEICQIRYDVVVDIFKYVMTLWLTDSKFIMGDLSDTLRRCGWSILYLLWEIFQIRFHVVVDRFYTYCGWFVRYVMTLWLIDSILIMGAVSDT